MAVFAKAPVPGAVKTRLAPALGDQRAAQVHARLTRRALETAIAYTPRVELWCAPDDRHPFFAECAARFGVTLRVQDGADLGERMSRAFAANRGRPLLVIGTDCPALDGGGLAAAAEALRTRDAVLIPAEDGGYVLIGLSRAMPELFAGIDWGSDRVMAQTRARLKRAGALWHELPTLWDVDRPEDYERLLTC